MPKLSSPTRESRRQELLDAGWRCLHRTGYQELTVAAICEEASASKGAFYGYFDSKQAFLLALLEEDVNKVGELMDRLERGHPHSLRRLRGFAEAMLERDQGRAQVRADLWAEMQSQPEVRRLLARAMARRRRRLRAWVEGGVAGGEMVPTPANALASLLLAMGDGLSLHAGLDPGAFVWGNIRRTLDQLLSGLAA